MVNFAVNKNRTETVGNGEMADESAETQVRIRLPAALKGQIDWSATKWRRSNNAEIVARLSQSFEQEKIIDRLRLQADADAREIDKLKSKLAALEELTPAARSGVPVVTELSATRYEFAVTEEMGFILDTKRQKNPGQPINEILASLLWDSVYTFPFQIDHLTKQNDRLRKESDRARNERYGGRAATAETDVLRQERQSLDAAKAERAAADRERDLKIDRLIGAATALVEKANGGKATSILAGVITDLETKVMDIATRSRMLRAKMANETALTPLLQVSLAELTVRIDGLALAVTAAVDMATGTTTPEAPSIIRGGNTL